jgi:hypothetical protein
MSKYLRVSNGGYKISVQPGAEIILDTGSEEGTVRVTGDLVVEGNTTTVQSENMTVKDNIIVLNSGETGSGITLDTSGLRIDRGTLSDGYFLFDENVSWRDPITETTKQGGFVFENESGSLVGIRTNSISTGGGDLYLINSGVGVISVTGTNNYELNVTDDDHITNKKYVDDAIIAAFASTLLTQIGDGVIDPTTVKALDSETTGLPSRVEIAIDTNVVANIYSDRFELGDIRIIGTKIETISSNEDLILSAPGTGQVRIDDTLQINNLPSPDDPSVSPSIPTDGLKLYVTNEATGGTGLFFVNAESRRDEIISNNRSLIYSMIF